jgi:D-alanyl-D-alanine carboxypeptidase (penicillin-binding protein 5/6)
MTGERTCVRRASMFVVTLAVALVGPGVPAMAESALAEPAVTPLDPTLEPLLRSHAGTVTAAARHLVTGETFLFQSDTPMPTASLVKLPVMVAAYAAAHAGQVTLNDTVRLSAEDLVPGSTVLGTFSCPPGLEFPLVDAIRAMMAASDNTATNLVIGRIGLPATNDLLDRIGLPGIRLNSYVWRRDTSLAPERSRTFGLGVGTAEEFVRLLAMIHSRELEKDGLVAPGACDAMLEHLLACQDRWMSPRSLPPGVRVAHKTGFVGGTRTDAGLLLWPAGPVAFCLLTADNQDQRGPGGAADDLAARFALELVRHFERPDEPAAAVATTLGLGSSGRLVTDLQRTLNARLGPDEADERIGTDGAFGPNTATAVRRFQGRAGLPETGVVDAKTWRALGTLVTADEPVPAPDEADAALPPKAPAERLDGPPPTTAAAWIVVDAQTGQTLGEHEADAFRTPASIVKVMTALVVLEAAEQVPGGLDEIVQVSPRAASEIGSSAELMAGDRVPVEELLYGLLLPSGNDAAVALAEHYGPRLAEGSGRPVDRFVEAMNAKAAALGLDRTRYGNPHGLTLPDRGSTARDTARLVRAALERPLFRQIVATRRRGATIENAAGFRREVVWTNTNRLLGIDGYLGVKTGTTQAAGCCLAAFGERADRGLVVVVLGATSSDARYTDARNLFRHAWRQLDLPSTPLGLRVPEPWMADGGAAWVLPNLDDDDGDGRPDADDDEVNGPADARDLTPLAITVADPGVVAVRLDGGGAPLRFFVAAAGGWRRVGAGVAEIPWPAPAADGGPEGAGTTVRTMELAIEGKAWAGPEWDGAAELRVTSLDTAGQVRATAVLPVRAVPVELLPATVPPREVFVASGRYDNEPFLTRLGELLEPTGVPLTVHPADAWQEMWMQDTMEIGLAQVPGGPWMHVVLDGLRGVDPFPAALLGPDTAVVRTAAPRDLSGGDDWADWYGNLEVSPPTDRHPRGLIVYGRNRLTGTTFHPDVVAFLAAQRRQEPVWIDTSWLTIKHVDEIVSFLPGRDGRGVVLVADPDEGLALADDARLSDADREANRRIASALRATLVGGEPGRAGRTRSDPREDVGGLLGLLGWGEDRVVRLPLVFRVPEGGLLPDGGVTNAVPVWSNPINSLLVGDLLICGSADMPEAVRAICRERLTAAGVPRIEFIDDAGYHRKGGNVHCATNARRGPGEARESPPSASP